jgi:hypothetical protein
MTHQPFWPAEIVRILQTSVSDGRRIYERRNLRHIRQTKLIEHIRISVLELAQVDVLFNILVFRTQLSQTSDIVNVLV